MTPPAAASTARALPDDGWPVLRTTAGDAELTDRLLAPLGVTARWWWILLAISGALTLLYVALIAYTVTTGIGVWGNNIPVAWAFGIVNFVWWIGIGHAGTFISAFLLLLNQRWRASVNRLAEAMTIFALVNAGLFPILHLGRPWFAYWLIPYPSALGVWPNFLSALPWDVAAVTTYFTVSLVFWYLGLVPDLATARDRLHGTWRRRVYGVFALGWRGTAREWDRYHVAYGLLAGLAAPLVISVHSVVSLDFAISQLPGWHSTIFPPYFVVGAIYSGLAMVLVLVIPVRHVFRLQDVITERHLQCVAKLLLAMALMLAYSYAVEQFMAWYSADPYERFTFLSARPRGPYAWAFWATMALNLLTPQLFWWERWRRSLPALFTAGILVLVGMWLERFLIIVSSLNRDFLPSSWHLYVPTLVDLGILAGSLGLFTLLILLFLRFVPLVSLSEVKQLRHELARERR